MPDLFSSGDESRREQLHQRGWKPKWNHWESPHGTLYSEQEAFRWLDEEVRRERESKKE